MPERQYRTLSKRIVDRLSVDSKDAVFGDGDSELLGFNLRGYPSGLKVYGLSGVAPGERQVEARHHRPARGECPGSDLPRVREHRNGISSEPKDDRAEPRQRDERGQCSDAFSHYDDNHNGRITYKEARRYGIAPVRHDHPAYRYMRGGDGIVCE